MVSSYFSSPNVLYSLGPTNEDIEIADEGPNVTVIAGETDAGMPSQEHTGKDPDVTVTTRKAAAGMPSQRHIVSLSVHDVHQSKEPLGLINSESFTLSRVSFLFNNA